MNEAECSFPATKMCNTYFYESTDNNVNTAPSVAGNHITLCKTKNHQVACHAIIQAVMAAEEGNNREGVFLVEFINCHDVLCEMADFHPLRNDGELPSAKWIVVKYGVSMWKLPNCRSKGPSMAASADPVILVKV